MVVVVQFHGGQNKTVKLLVLKWKKKEKCTWVWWFEKVLNEVGGKKKRRRVLRKNVGGGGDKVVGLTTENGWLSLSFHCFINFSRHKLGHVIH